jgi:SAM-dependent methyltransferase
VIYDSRASGALHRQRGFAESFGTDVERYDRTRDKCPRELLDRLVAASSAGSVLDVGCGTGIVARQFQGAGCDVLAVEPDVRMAEFARGTGTGIEVEVATFEAWEPAGRAFDIVTAGSAWHWVDPFTGAAKAAEVLRPGGRLAPFWHMYELPADVTGAYAAAVRRVAPGSPGETWLSPQKRAGYESILSAATEGMNRCGCFTAPDRWETSWERGYTRETWLDHMLTQGTLATLPEEQQGEILDSVGAVIDVIGGSFTLAYTTVAVTAQKTSS